MHLAAAHRPSLPHRLTAVLGVALVLLLNLLAAWPEAHEFFHHGGHAPAQHAPAGQEADADNDAGCVVTLFAHGHVLAALILLLLCLGALVRSGEFFCPRPLAFSAVDYRLPPGCGPPLV